MITKFELACSGMDWATKKCLEEMVSVCGFVPNLDVSKREYRAFKRICKEDLDLFPWGENETRQTASQYVETALLLLLTFYSYIEIMCKNGLALPGSFSIPRGSVFLREAQYRTWDDFIDWAKDFTKETLEGIKTC